MKKKFNKKSLCLAAAALALTAGISVNSAMRTSPPIQRQQVM